jgi:CRISPR/Cas system Type II protein with McrA/HNH and RuvC-like nuclease domain
MKNNQANEMATKTELMRLIKVQNYRCALSGFELTVDNSELDHKLPVSMGGDNSINNLQWVSKEVNRAKGTMSNADFIDMCKKVSSWNR